MQMQAGTTGINTTRVYNPIKQAQDHDPHGHFVRRWLPRCAACPMPGCFEPWRMPPDVQARCGVRVGDDIALPLVDLDQATRAAKARVHGLRAQARGARGQGRDRAKARLARAPRQWPAPQSHGPPPAANPGLLTHAHAQKTRPAAENLPALRTALYLAQKVGKGVGRGEVLL
jgi:hypothetical protein